jgi:hypothetical protein
LERERTEAQVEAKATNDKIELLLRQIEECKDERRLNKAEPRLFAETSFPAEQPVELHQKLGISRAFFARPEIAAREHQITAAFQFVTELQGLAVAADAADRAQARHRDEDLKRQAEAPVPLDDDEELNELMRLAFGDPMLDDDDYVDAAARDRELEQRRVFRERLSQQLAKRRRQGLPFA